MENDRIKNTTRNVVAGVANKLISIFFPFAINTIIIKTLGVEYLGLNSLFASILQVLGLTELGFGSAMIFSMYEPVAKNDYKKISALLAMYRKVYLVIGTVILCGGLVCIPALPNLIEGNVPDGINIYILFLISLFNSGLSYFMFGYRSAIFRANQRTDIIEVINGIIDILLNLSKIAILILVKNYYLFCLLQPVYTAISSLMTFFVSKRMYPEYKCAGAISREERKSIFSRVFGLSINKICNVISNSFDSIIISSFLGLTILGEYNNYFVITNAILAFLYVIPTSACSSIGNSLVCESLEKNYDDFNTFHFGFCMITGWASICILCLIQPFIEIWLGDSLMFDDVTAAMYSVYLYAILSPTVLMTYREAAGIWSHDKIRPFVEAGLNLLLNIVLVQVIGVAGVMLSTIFTMGIIRTVWGSYFLFSEYFKGFSRSKYLLKMLIYFIITAVAGGASYLICNFMQLDGLVQLIVRFVICIIVPGMIFWVCFSRSREFKKSILLIKSIIRRRRA